MRRCIVLITLAFVAAVSLAAYAASLPGPAFPDYRDATEVKVACERGLAGAAARLRRLERVPGGPT